MVGDDDGSAVLRNAVLVDDAGAVDDPHDPEAHHADEFAGNETERHNRDDHAQGGQHPELVLDGEDVPEHELEADGHQAHQAVHQVARGDDRAAVGGIAVVLEVGVQRHQVRGGEGSRDTEADVAGQRAGSEEGQEDAADGEADRAQGDEAQFNFFTANDGGYDAAHHRAAAEPRHENGRGHAESGAVNGVLLGDLEGDEHQGPGQEPEVGDADFAEPQVPLAPQVLELHEVLVKELPLEFPGLVGRVPGKGQGRDGYGNGDAGEDERGEGGGFPAVVGGNLQDVEPDEDADLRRQHGQDEAHFHQPGGVAKLAGAHHVLHHPFFRRAQDGRLDGEDAEPEDGHFNVLILVAQEHGPQHQDLEERHELDDAGLAEAVRQPADEGGEQDIGQYEDAGQNVLEGVDPGVRPVHGAVGGQPDAQGNQQELGGFFIEGVLGLNENQGIKAPPFLF